MAVELTEDANPLVLLEYWEKAGDSEKTLDYVIASVKQWMAKDNAARALALAEPYLATPFDSLHPERYAELLSAVAVAAGELGDFGRQIELLERLRELASEARLPHLEFKALDRMIHVALNQGDWESFKTLLSKASSLAGSQNSPDMKSQVLQWHGRFHYQRRHFDEAEMFYTEAAQLRADEGLPPTVSSSSSLAKIAQKRGDYQAALDHYQTVIDATDSKLTAIRIRVNMGNVAYLQGNYELACEQYLLCAEHFEVYQDKWNLGIVLNNLGSAYVRLGNTDAALDAFERTLKLSLEVQGITLTLAVIVELAELLMYAGPMEKAVEWIGLAINHPNRDLDVMDTAEPLLASFQKVLGATQVEAALNRGRQLDLNDVAQDILTMLAALRVENTDGST
ncbi:MAG: tetratricopeptide repeat protein [Chloroflexi bacterium]|nr:tetratricopeptide repeat protein [Chloroflexota bacterium]